MQSPKNTITRSREAVAILLAMLAFVPWPFYLFAVLELQSPLMMTARAMTSPLLAVFGLPQAVLAAFLFDYAARALAGAIRRSSVPRASLVSVIGLAFAVSWLPLFGGGENTLRGKLHNLYIQAMIDTGRMLPPEVEKIMADERRRHPPPPRHTRIVDGVEVLDGPQLVIPAASSTSPVSPGGVGIAETREQLECMKHGGTAQSCGLRPAR